MLLEAGTSGYSYKAWKGSFYPEDLPERAMLAFYAEHFRSVEINSSFYRMPKREVLEKWASEVPPHFTFVLKASQRITHIKRLKEVGSEVEYFFTTCAVLGERLGPVLFQLPPNAKKDLDRLRAFLALLPRERQVAMEFRHESWSDDEVYTLLREANVALCLADGEGDDEEAGGEPPPQREIVPTANFGYLRLRRCDYDEAALKKWADHIRAQSWSRAFVYFKHEDEGTGPKLAKQFIELWGR